MALEIYYNRKMSLEALVKEKVTEVLDPPEDVEDLDLEGITEIKSLSQADQTFLERFSAVIFLSFKRLGLESLDHLPSLPLLQLVSARTRK